MLSSSVLATDFASHDDYNKAPDALSFLGIGILDDAKTERVFLRSKASWYGGCWVFTDWLKVLSVWPSSRDGNDTLEMPCIILWGCGCSLMMLPIRGLSFLSLRPVLLGFLPSRKYWNTFLLCKSLSLGDWQYFGLFRASIIFSLASINRWPPPPRSLDCPAIRGRVKSTFLRLSFVLAKASEAFMGDLLRP